MKAYVREQSGLSRAMARVSSALARHAPAHVEIVNDKNDADLVVLHVIGHPETVAAVNRLKSEGRQYAIIQYCLRTTQRPNTADWAYGLWSGAQVVWSYYDLQQMLVDDEVFDGHPMRNFYHAPLGIDDAFTSDREGDRSTLAVTSGYVSGPCAEAIEEVVVAAGRRKGSVLHLGPQPVGMAHNSTMKCLHDVDDATVARMYSGAQWVSGLRHGEGFELPALEGLVCGARPVLFDRPEMRRWYGPHAEYVPECHGEELVARLMELFGGSRPVPRYEREEVRARFAWGLIADGFWERATA